MYLRTYCCGADSGIHYYSAKKKKKFLFFLAFKYRNIKIYKKR